MAYQEQREEVIFVAFGKEKAKPNSYVVNENESIEGLVLQIKDSQMYKKVYQLQIKTANKPVVLTGNTALNDGMGYGSKVVPEVKVGDAVRITYLGMFETGMGKKAYKLRVEVDR